MHYHSIYIYKHKSYLQSEITLIELAPSPYFIVKSICLVDMNMFGRFGAISAMTLEDIKETKRYGLMHTQTDNVKTVYPPTNPVCRGIISRQHFQDILLAGLG